MRHFGSIGSPKLSPDGKHVLLQVTESTADGAASHIWLIDVVGGGKRQLTFSPDSDKMGERSAEWMPDGQSILFVAHRGEHTTLYQLPMGGGEAKPIVLKVTPMVDMSKVPNAVPPAKGDSARPDKVEPVVVDAGGFRVSPDGKTIAFLIRDPQTAGEKREKDAKADANFKDHDDHRERLYLMDLATGKLSAAAAVPGDARGALWTPDGKQMAVLANAPNGASDLAPAGSVWMVSHDDLAHPTKLDAIPPTVGSLVWNESGSELMFEAQAKIDAPPGFHDLYSYSVSAKSIKNLTDGLLASVGREPVVLKDGSVVSLVEQGFHESPAKLLGGGKFEAFTTPVPVISAMETNEAQNGWVFMGSGAGHTSALYFAEKLGAPMRVLSTPVVVPAGLETTVAGKHVEWKNEGLTIEGMLYLPPEAASGKVPLIVEVHGGPMGVYIDSYSQFDAWMLGKGWAILRTNPRGSTGRGAAFAAANHNDLGGADYRDIMTGVDFVLKSEPLDETKMALEGYSYGGEMAAFVEGKTTRFKAIVSMAPVIDQNSEYGTESGSSYDRWYYGKPWEHYEDAWRQSPLSGAAKAKTPFMLLQGEADTTDPLGQSLEMYRALKQEGVAVQLITYPRDNHGPLGGAINGAPVRELWHGFDARQRIDEFFTKAFSGAPMQ